MTLSNVLLSEDKETIANSTKTCTMIAEANNKVKISKSQLKISIGFQSPQTH